MLTVTLPLAPTSLYHFAPPDPVLVPQKEASACGAPTVLPLTTDPQVRITSAVGDSETNGVGGEDGAEVIGLPVLPKPLKGLVIDSVEWLMQV